MKISRCLRPALLAACALTLPLTACKRAPEFSAETHAALKVVEETDWEGHNISAQAVAEVLKAYRETGDPNAGADEGLSILDLACAARQKEFAEALLKQGADARTGSPLKIVLWTSPEPDSEEAETEENERTIALIDLLMAHGADANAPGFDSLLSTAACYSSEAVFLHLLDKGAKPQEKEEIATAPIVAARAWNEALRRLIGMKAPLADDSMTALHAATTKDMADEHAETMRLLLEAGADVNALNEEGYTPLFLLARTLDAEPTEDDRECLRLLLEHGATVSEPTVSDETYGEVCAYDFLSAHAELIDELREEGFTIPDLPIIIREEEKYLSGDLLRAELRLSNHPQAEELLKPHVPLFAKVLTQHLYGANGEMAGAAFSLLSKGDKALAEQILPHLPIWTNYREWVMQQESLSAGDVILSLLAEAEEDEPTFLTLPKDSILHAAAMLNEYGATLHATAVTELLEFAPEAEEDIERLCKDDSAPALQLGAMTAKLHLAGLPDAKVGTVEAWLGDYNPACLPPAVMKALRLTNLETFWFGDMDTTERAVIVADIESLGLSTVADIYRKALPDGLTDDELADIMDEAAGHAIELELAVDRFILDNSKDFERAKETLNK